MNRRHIGTFTSFLVVSLATSQIAAAAIREQPPAAGTAGPVPANEQTKGELEALLAASLKDARKHPDAPEKKLHLQTLLAGAPRLERAEFVRLRPLLTEAAEFGVHAAMMLLVEHLNASDPVTAFNWCSVAAHEGYVPAVARLGVMLCDRMLPGTPDYGKAMQCFQFAIERGDSEAKAALAECHLRGTGVPRDLGRALDLFRQASAAGNAKAMNRLGDLLNTMGADAKRRREPSEPFFAEAIQLFTKASGLGYYDALGNLGVMTLNGDGAPADPKLAVTCFEEGARAGNPYCMFLYGRCLEHGIGIPKDLMDGKFWYRKSAQAGNRQAEQWCLRNGVDVSLP
jgi:TPR repeat protein